ncbi:hypothetical protein [Arthrobacter sp. NPDC058127]|uniref:hypothetical protein n=1 Tax=Arthrobacter sp. NPDC058127 TaxID=3346351 RepID=UPI0036F05404
MDDEAAGGTELYPVEGVVQQDGKWAYTPLGISILAPRPIIRPGDSPEDFVRAREALDSGLASARHVGHRSFLNKLLCAAPLPATASAALLPGGVRAQAQSLTMMLRKLGWPLALVTGAWWGTEPTGLLILGLLSAMVFLVLVSLILHELGHVATFRIFAPSAPALFSVRAGRLRLVRCCLPKHQDLAVTIAGPAAPLILPVVLWLFYASLPVLFWTSAVVAGSHLALLLRDDGDGRMLRVALRQGPA